MKTFVLGFVCGGVLVSAGVYWALQTQGETSGKTLGVSMLTESAARPLEAPLTNPTRQGPGKNSGASAVADLAGDVGAEPVPDEKTKPDELTPARPANWLSASSNVLILKQRAHQKSAPTLLELHDRFAEENLDPEWAYSAENLLTLFLGTEAANRGHELVGVSCRRTLCEIELRSAAPEARNDIYRLIDRIYAESWGRGFGPWLGIDNQFGPETVTLVAISRGTHQP